MQKFIIVLASLIVLLATSCRDEERKDRTPVAQPPTEIEVVNNKQLAPKELVNYAAVQYTIAAMYKVNKGQNKTDQIITNEKFGSLQPSQIKIDDFLKFLVADPKNGPLKEKWEDTKASVTEVILTWEGWITIDEIADTNFVFRKKIKRKFLDDDKRRDSFGIAADSIKTQSQAYNKQKQAAEQNENSENHPNKDDSPIEGWLVIVAVVLLTILAYFIYVHLCHRSRRNIKEDTSLESEGHSPKVIATPVTQQNQDSTNQTVPEACNANSDRKAETEDIAAEKQSKQTDAESAKNADTLNSQSGTTPNIGTKLLVTSKEEKESEPVPVSPSYFAVDYEGNTLIKASPKKSYFRIFYEKDEWKFEFSGNNTQMAINYRKSVFSGNCDVTEKGNKNIVTLSPGTVKQISDDTWLVTKKAKIEIR